MKHALLAISISAAVAGAAQAEDRAAIEQHGSGSAVTIEQIASRGDNQVQVAQHSGWNGSQVQVTQIQVAGSSVDIRQAGDNHVSVTQRDGGGLKAEVFSNDYYYGQGGERNYVSIEQSGFDAWARVEQMYGASNNHVKLLQESQGGVGAMVSQHGYTNQANIMQAGSNLTATIMQGGSDNSASIVQRSY